MHFSGFHFMYRLNHMKIYLYKLKRVKPQKFYVVQPDKENVRSFHGAMPWQQPFFQDRMDLGHCINSRIHMPSSLQQYLQGLLFGRQCTGDLGYTVGRNN